LLQQLQRQQFTAAALAAALVSIGTIAATVDLDSVEAAAAAVIAASPCPGGCCSGPAAKDDVAKSIAGQSLMMRQHC